jgi:hypothetical protein
LATAPVGSRVAMHRSVSNELPLAFPQPRHPWRGRLHHGRCCRARPIRPGTVVRRVGPTDPGSPRV